MSDGSRGPMLEWVAPTTRLRDAWLEAHREWGPGAHEDGFGLVTTDDVHTAPGFAAWLSRLGAGAEAGAVMRWIVEGDRVLGGIALRLGPPDLVQRAGHIGFGVRPSARRRGVATWALGRMLDTARVAGLTQVLLVCDAANLASAATIERAGGVLDGILDTPHGPVRRYRIPLEDPPA